MKTVHVLNAASKAMDVVGALRQCGHKAFATSDSALINAGEIALVVGPSSWGTPAAERFLQKAGDRGAIRAVWQIEPLLPPVTSHNARNIVSKLLSSNRRKNDLVERRTHSLREMVLCQHLAWACRSEPWGHQLFSGHAFKYPLQQSRCLLAYCHAGLIDHLLVSLVPRQQFLARLDIPSHFVPFGYVPEFGRWLGEQPRDIDVLFLGRLSSRRRIQLLRLEKTLCAAPPPCWLATRLSGPHFCGCQPIHLTSSHLMRAKAPTTLIGSLAAIAAKNFLVFLLIHLER